MDRVSYMTDFISVRLIGLAQAAEKNFELCLMSAPIEGDTIRIDDRGLLTRLLDQRMTSLLLSLAALENHLSLWAQDAAERNPGLTFDQALEVENKIDQLKSQPGRLRRRLDLYREEFGSKPLRGFLVSPRLTLEEKLIYFPLLRTGRLPSLKDGHMKKLVRLLVLRDDLLNPDLLVAPELSRLGEDGLAGTLLAHDLPAGLTPGKSASDRFITEPYEEGHFLWELLHVYPARTVQEIIQFLANLDGSDYHFISVVCAEEHGEGGDRRCEIGIRLGDD